MATQAAIAEQRTVLENISWKTFEALLRETGEHRGSRFAYDRGTLEIMTPLYEHESYHCQLGNFVLALAEELEVEIKSAGSTTLKRRDLERGIESDKCFYIQNELVVRGKKELELAKDPPPDLAIEIDITSSCVNKLGIYSALGVPELWRHNGRILRFYRLQEGEYVDCDRSVAFPLVKVSDIARFLEQSQTMGEIALLRSFRAWVRQNQTR